MWYNRIGSGLGHVQGIWGCLWCTKKSHFFNNLCKVKMKKITETEISTRIATENLGVGTEPEQEKKKPRFAVKAPTRAAHLKPHQWKKGKSGNPKGRPVNALSLTANLRKRLENHPELKDAIINALIVLSTKPNPSQLGAIQTTFDRMDGKLTETHKIEGVLPVTLLFRPAEEVLALERGGTVEGEFKEISEEGRENNGQ